MSSPGTEDIAALSTSLYPGITLFCKMLSDLCKSGHFRRKGTNEVWGE